MIKQFTDEEFLELAVSLPTKHQKYLQSTVDGNYERVGYVKVTVDCRYSMYRPAPMPFQGDYYAMIVTPLNIMEGIRRSYYVYMRGVPFAPLFFDFDHIPKSGIIVNISTVGIITINI